jgi:hypothetical protein
LSDSSRTENGSRQSVHGQRAEGTEHEGTSTAPHRLEEVWAAFSLGIVVRDQNGDRIQRIRACRGRPY